ncbi:MAG: 4Fe-4S dicluster domain-containing protein [Planctomycetota bacterium]|jgi:NAD-dependent dihydropyrimidine dehydrogenase PreA subunit
MAFLSVDETKCQKDGLCTKVCPLGLIQPGGENQPTAVRMAEKACIRCGHCLAVCPHDALSLETVEAPLGPLPAGWNLSLDQVAPLLKGRRAVRSYGEEYPDDSVGDGSQRR